MLDLFSLPSTLSDLDSVPVEFQGLYEAVGPGQYALTETAAENFQKIAAGIQELTAQRDKATSAADARFIESKVLAAILAAGARGQLAAGAAAQFEAENKIKMDRGLPVVETDAGTVPLDDAVRSFMQGEGRVFLPSSKPPEQDQYFLRQIQRFTR
jgi:hypothetical protein